MKTSKKIAIVILSIIPITFVVALHMIYLDKHSTYDLLYSYMCFTILMFVLFLLNWALSQFE